MSSPMGAPKCAAGQHGIPSGDQTWPWKNHYFIIKGTTFMWDVQLQCLIPEVYINQLYVRYIRNHSNPM